MHIRDPAAVKALGELAAELDMTAEAPKDAMLIFGLPRSENWKVKVAAASATTPLVKIARRRWAANGSTTRRNTVLCSYRHQA